MSDSLYISEIFSSIQGEGMLAGRRQIFLRLTECNLDCRCCDTDFGRSPVCRLESEPGAAEFVDLPQPVALRKVTDVITDWKNRLPGAHHSVSITGGEPLLEAESLTEWLPEIRRIMPVHLETNGTMFEALKRVIGHVDWISMDMKLPSTSGCAGDLWERHELFLREALASQVSVKVVVGEATELPEIDAVCEIIGTVHPDTPLFLQPLTLPDGTIGISARRLLRLQEQASSRLPDVRVIPQTHKLLRLL